MDENLHPTTTACVAENGFVVPHMFIYTGQKINLDITDQCKIYRSVIYFPEGIHELQAVSTVAGIN